MWKLIVWALQWNINSSVFLKCQYHGAGLRRWCGGLTLELSRRGEKLVNRKYLSNQPGLISEVDKMGCCWLPAADSEKPSSTSLPLQTGVFPEAGGRSHWTCLPFPFPLPFCLEKLDKGGHEERCENQGCNFADASADAQTDRLHWEQLLASCSAAVKTELIRRAAYSGGKTCSMQNKYPCLRRTETLHSHSLLQKHSTYPEGLLPGKAGVSAFGCFQGSDCLNSFTVAVFMYG